MKEELIQVKELPEHVDFNVTFEITSTDVSYFTHGFFKYPCKFIPQIPRWAILKYSRPRQLVLDPFAGSGTSLVEAVLHERNALGIDFDKFSQLLCKTKSTLLTKDQIDSLSQFGKYILKSNSRKASFRPDLHNISHWFPENNIQMLSYLKGEIEHKFNETGDEVTYNFLRTCFASIIRKCSYADDTSPKPYVSKRIKKKPLSVREAFSKTLNSYINAMSEYGQEALGKVSMISEDARQINAPEYNDKTSLAITSPPYINAFDYVRSLRLENAWLGFYGDSNIVSIKKKQVGTETIPASVYQTKIKDTGISKLDLILKKIHELDKKRAFVVLKFFDDMSKNFSEVRKLLVDGAHYVVVIGESKIRNIDVPTPEILIDIAKQNQFRLENLFSYIIKNRYLRIPRSGRGGLIKKDWIVDLVK